ncbi:MAG: hypothetical protein OEZ37_13840, partial [Gemmatimonadota bacterium]|nr:hypothetical protein [Gemmatimonadota bacterium]
PAFQRYAVVALWVTVFTGMSAVQGVGDGHPGQYLPYWEDVCETGNERGCDYLAVMQQNYCDRGSAWACNEFGAFLLDHDGDRRGSLAEFERACGMGFDAGCRNARMVNEGTGELARSRPALEELPVLLRGSKGPVTQTDPAALVAMACAQGWEGACEW